MKNSRILTINGRKIGEDQPTFVTAEISGNHNQEYAEAVKLIKAAAAAGADAVKFQTYTPDTMTIDSNKKYFIVAGKDNPRSWKGRSLYSLYKETFTPWSWFPKLKKLTDELNIIFFSTPFDQSAVDLLEDIGVPCYKISSYEVTDIPLLAKIASTRKPVFLSVGFASRNEVDEAVETLRTNGCKQIALLHCVTTYSSNPDIKLMNLRTINHLKDRYGVVAGFSDNNGGIEAPLFAVAMGASIIEKHFILKRQLGGPDSQFSIEPAELKILIDTIRRFDGSKGVVSYGPADEKERYNKRFRRSIFSVSDIKRGEIFTKDNIRVIRPEFGLKPALLSKVIGKIASHNIARGTPIKLNMTKSNDRK